MPEKIAAQFPRGPELGARYGVLWPLLGAFPLVGSKPAYYAREFSVTAGGGPGQLLLDLKAQSDQVIESVAVLPQLTEYKLQGLPVAVLLNGAQINNPTGFIPNYPIGNGVLDFLPLNLTLVLGDLFEIRVLGTATIFVHTTTIDGVAMARGWRL